MDGMVFICFFDYMDFQLFQKKSHTVASLLAQHQPKMSINDQIIVPCIFKQVMEHHVM